MHLNLHESNFNVNVGIVKVKNNWISKTCDITCYKYQMRIALIKLYWISIIKKFNQLLSVFMPLLILFHGKKAKSMKIVKSREHVDDDSSDDLEQLEQLANQLSDIDTEDDDDEDPPKVNPHVQSTFDKILHDTLFGNI